MDSAGIDSSHQRRRQSGDKLPLSLITCLGWFVDRDQDLINFGEMVTC
jgi:hypothetical protein